MSGGKRKKQKQKIKSDRKRREMKEKRRIKWSDTRGKGGGKRRGGGRQEEEGGRQTEKCIQLHIKTAFPFMQPALSLYSVMMGRRWESLSDLLFVMLPVSSGWAVIHTPAAL